MLTAKDDPSLRPIVREPEALTRQKYACTGRSDRRVRWLRSQPICPTLVRRRTTGAYRPARVQEPATIRRFACLSAPSADISVQRDRWLRRALRGTGGPVQSAHCRGAESPGPGAYSVCGTAICSAIAGEYRTRCHPGATTKFRVYPNGSSTRNRYCCVRSTRYIYS